MTYQVSYCVFTAATVEAYVMKSSDPTTVTESAKRLGAAMRVLHDEAKHTPGIGRSLDTIRRRLATWNPNARSRTYAETEEATPWPARRQQDSEILRRPQYTDVTNVQHDCANSAATATSLEPQAMRVDPAHDQNVTVQAPLGATQTPDFRHNDHGIGGFGDPAAFNFGSFDTGAGFHPDAFPWSIADMLHGDAIADPYWGHVQP